MSTLTTDDKAPKLLATVQLQYWDARDYAHDAAPAFTIDVTEMFLSMTLEEQAALRDNTEEADRLYLRHAEAHGGAHEGPFYVHIESALADYHLETAG